MKDKINIAELLRDCPKGMELYSPLCGKCVFDRLNMGTIICKKQNTQEITFTSEGYYMIPVFDDCECMIFPSKDQRDWSKFQRPFKDGDIAVSSLGGIHIMQNSTTSYCYFDRFGILNKTKTTCVRVERLATEEEKKKLFNAIKANGYRWNEETKTLERLPRFKVGDRIKHISAYPSGIVVKVDDKGYHIDYPKGEGVCYINFTLEKYYELAPNKFDITTLKPFKSRVLVRDYDNMIWVPTFWGKYLKDGSNCSYLTTNGCYKYCIPYEGNQHLLGTTNDCDEFYKTWK